MRYLPGLLAHLTRRLRDREAARELANDVLMAVVQAMRAARIREPERLPGFVYGTARNLANGYLRMRRAHPPAEPLGAEVAAAEPGDGVEHGERLARVRAGLDALRHAERQILLLTLDGLKPGAIAERLGLSAQVVRARKARAMRKLEAHVRLSGRSRGRVLRGPPPARARGRPPWPVRRPLATARRS